MRLPCDSRKAPDNISTRTGQVEADMSEAEDGWIAFPRDSLNLAVGRHYYDVTVTDPNGKTDTIGIGVSTVNAAIGRTA